jgi:DNA polymerase III subunit epsilon
MELNLKNPIAFIDLETTGVDVAKDRIVEISILKVYPNQKQEITTLKINPEMPIPPATTAIHGISDADVKDAPTFAQEAKNIAGIIEGCDLAGYNSNKFDFPLLAEEFLRVGTDIDLKRHKFIDVQVIFHKKERRTLEAAYEFYCGQKLENAHSAEADIKATYEVLKGQLDKYEDLENDTEYLAKFSAHKKQVDFAGRLVYNNNGEEVFNFGKNKGKTVESVLEKQPGYYDWIMKSDFPLYTKKVLTEIKLRKFGF